MKKIRDIINSDSLWDRESPASSDLIENLVLESGLQLPEDYLDFLRLSNGGEGELPVDPFWFQIWPAEEVLDRVLRSQRDSQTTKPQTGQQLQRPAVRELPDDEVQEILTVAIITIPFSFEGRKRKMQAIEGIKELKKHCDAVMISAIPLAAVSKTLSALANALDKGRSP